MRNPGGYGQLICDDPSLKGRDRFGRVIAQTHDTITCNHCGTVVLVNAGERPEDIGGFCKRCMKCICGPCVDEDRCRPIERWLEEQERAINHAIERRRLYTASM
jgi:hypothetical protein